MAERTIVLDGFSKTYSMTGWRLGYAIVPPELVPVFSRLIINSVSCTSSLLAARRGRGAHRAPGRGRCDGRRVPGAADARRRWPERAAGCHLPDAPRRVLRVPGCQRHRHEWPGVRRAAVAGGGRERPVRAPRSGASGATISGCRTPTRARTSSAALERMARLLGGAAGRMSERPRVLVTRQIPEAGLRLLREVGVRRCLGRRPAAAARRAAAPGGGCRRAAGAADGPGRRRAARRGRAAAQGGQQLRGRLRQHRCRRVRAAGHPRRQHPGRAHGGDRGPRVHAAARGRAAHPGGERLRPRRPLGDVGAAAAPGQDVSGATLGIVGFGRIGREVARRARGFGMRVLYYEPQPCPGGGRVGAGGDLGRLRRACWPRATS